MSIDHGSITPQMLRYGEEIRAMARTRDALDRFKNNEIDIFPDMSPDAALGNFQGNFRRVTIPAAKTLSLQADK